MCIYIYTYTVYEYTSSLTQTSPILTLPFVLPPITGHRKGVLDPRYDTVGVAYGPHCTFGQMAAMEFARGWEPDADAVRHWDAGCERLGAAGEMGTVRPGKSVLRFVWDADKAASTLDLPSSSDK